MFSHFSLVHIIGRGCPYQIQPLLPQRVITQSQYGCHVSVCSLYFRENNDLYASCFVLSHQNFMICFCSRKQCVHKKTSHVRTSLYIQYFFAKTDRCIHDLFVVRISSFRVHTSHCIFPGSYLPTPSVGTGTSRHSMR